MDNLEARVRKSFGGNFGRFVGSSDSVGDQTVGQASAQSSLADKPCGTKKSDSPTSTY